MQPSPGKQSGNGKHIGQSAFSFGSSCVGAVENKYPAAVTKTTFSARPMANSGLRSIAVDNSLKTKNLLKTAAERASGPTTKPNPKPESKPPDSLRRGASQAASAAPTLRYGPAGDSAPRLRLKASSMAERFLSARPHGPNALVWGASPLYDVPGKPLDLQYSLAAIRAALL